LLGLELAAADPEVAAERQRLIGQLAGLLGNCARADSGLVVRPVRAELSVAAAVAVALGLAEDQGSHSLGGLGPELTVLLTIVIT
jgi:hypothetical protein